MRWSFSAYNSFRKCPRQWFYKQIFSSSRANDPVRKEAYRLSKLENIQAWRGKVVDTTISEIIIPSLTNGSFIPISEAQRAVLNLFDTQRAQRMSDYSNNQVDKHTNGTFFELEYEIPIAEEIFAKARLDVQQAISNFYNSEYVLNLISESKWLFPQRNLSFKHGDITVQVRPDLLLFRITATPVIFDWKVNARPLRDYWLQLVTGAIALTRCKPHIDWPLNAIQFGCHEIELLEIQLLKGDVRIHKVSQDDIEDAEDLISISASQMQFACGYEDMSKLSPQDFHVASDPWVCQICPFRKLCWEQVL